MALTIEYFILIIFKILILQDKSLGSELESFYSDIASLDTAGEAAPLAPIEVIDKATTDKLISEVKKKKKKVIFGVRPGAESFFTCTLAPR